MIADNKQRSDRDQKLIEASRSRELYLCWSCFSTDGWMTGRTSSIKKPCSSNSQWTAKEFFVLCLCFYRSICQFVLDDYNIFLVDLMLWVCYCRVGFGAEQISRWLAERADIQVSSMSLIQFDYSNCLLCSWLNLSVLWCAYYVDITG